MRRVAAFVAVTLAVACSSPSADVAAPPSPTPSGLPISTAADVAVPQVVGYDLPDALAALRAVGLDPIVREVASPDPAGTVVATNPETGRLPTGDPVIVTVSDGTLAREPFTPPPRDKTVVAPDEEALPPPSRQSGAPIVDVVDSGFSWASVGSDRSPAVSVGVVVRNATSSDGRSFTVKFIVRDAAGNARGSDDRSLAYAPASTTMYLGEVIYLDPGTEPASLEVLIEQPEPANERLQPPGTFSGLRYRDKDIYGEWHNPLDEQVEDWWLSCVTFARGQVTGGGWVPTGIVGANSSTAFRMGNGPVQGMSVDDIRCFGWSDHYIS